MAVFKCKMCGGTLSIDPSQTIAVCDYCGSKQTLPKLDNEERANLYDRANHFRRNDEFDKAMGIYERILNEDRTDAEAYWSLVLCRYGIEYVEDPATHKRVPTVNRAQYTSIFDDEDYKSALQYADGAQRAVYEQEANAINEIQKGILAISQNEEPFDVFLCYKETDDNTGMRTPDSVLATELYYELKDAGLKVFFARITLEDKLGTAYEPYIFSALHSAKVMVVLGTKPSYFNAPWVKNEWSRFLGLIKSGEKKILIPAYRDMDPYDLPEEFSHLQAQDMNKLGFMQDLIHGIEKLTESDTPKAEGTDTVIVEGGDLTTPLLKRAFLYLEDGDWAQGNAYCERVLDRDPENAEAYLGKLMAELHCRTRAQLSGQSETFEENPQYLKVLRFADNALKDELKATLAQIRQRQENAKLEKIYTEAVNGMATAQTEEAFRLLADQFESIADYQDAKQKAAECVEKAEAARKDAIYAQAEQAQKKAKIESLEQAIQLYESIPMWRDAEERTAACRLKIEELRYAEQRKQQLAEEKRILREKKAKKRKKIMLIAAPFVAAAIVFLTVLVNVILPKGHYNEGLSLMAAGDYPGAIQAFTQAGSYADSPEQLSSAQYAYGKQLLDAQDYLGAIDAFRQAGSYADSQQQLISTYYAYGQQCLLSNDYFQALTAFSFAGDYQNSRELVATLCNPMTRRQTSLSMGDKHLVGITNGGTALAAGEDLYHQLNVSRWTDLISVSAGSQHTVGLKADGTVVATGDNSEGQCNVSTWTDIIAVSAGGMHTVGLKADGTVVATGDNSKGACDVGSWSHVVDVRAGDDHTVALLTDGTVVATGSNTLEQCNVSDWENIVAIDADNCITVGLKMDGTVVATGYNEHGQCDVSSWSNIVAISAGRYHTLGLKADGTVVAAGDNSFDQCEVGQWNNIVAISAGGFGSAGLKADGTVVVIDTTYSDIEKAANWRASIRLPVTQ